MINLGNIAIGNIKLGINNVTAIYLGTTKVFPLLTNINITSYISSGRLYVSADHPVTSNVNVTVQTRDDFDHVVATPVVTINIGNSSAYITKPTNTTTSHILSITPTSDSSSTYTNADLL